MRPTTFGVLVRDAEFATNQALLRVCVRNVVPQAALQTGGAKMVETPTHHLFLKQAQLAPAVPRERWVSSTSKGMPCIDSCSPRGESPNGRDGLRRHTSTCGSSATSDSTPAVGDALPRSRSLRRGITPDPPQPRMSFDRPARRFCEIPTTAGRLLGGSSSLSDPLPKRVCSPVGAIGGLTQESQTNQAGGGLGGCGQCLRAHRTMATTPCCGLGARSVPSE